MKGRPDVAQGRLRAELAHRLEETYSEAALPGGLLMTGLQVEPPVFYPVFAAHTSDSVPKLIPA